MARSTKWADNEIENLRKEMLEFASENDGELSDEHLAKLVGLEDLKDRIVEETIIEFKALNTKAEMFKAQIKGLKEHMDAITDEATTLKKTIGFMLNGDTYSSGTSMVKYGKSTKTVYAEWIEESINEGKVPKGYEEYCDITEVVKMPKKALTDALKNKVDFGEDVKLVYSTNINIK